MNMKYHCNVISCMLLIYMGLVITHQVRGNEILTLCVGIHVVTRFCYFIADLLMPARVYLSLIIRLLNAVVILFNVFVFAVIAYLFNS